MLLQQCAVKTVVLTAIETQCGFQPFFTYASENYTVGSIHAKSTNAVRDQITDFHENLTTYW